MALTPRATHVLQWSVQRAAISRGGANPQSRPQFRLESATRLHEGGIASNPNQQVAVNTFPGLVHTARQATEVGGTRSRLPNRKEGGAEGKTNDWG